MAQKYSPMIMQYLSIKENYQDTLILFRLGDFYELFFDDAKIASKELQLTLTGKNAGTEERVPMCGVPHHAVKSYIQKLVIRGYKVGIVEQVEDPATAKGIVKRDVVQIITPGAFMDLSSDENNYIVAADETDFNYVLSFADLSTGEVGVLNCEKDVNALLNELDGLSARELVLKSSFDKNSPNLTPSTIDSAALSPSPSIELNAGIILPSIIWKVLAFALNKSIGINS